MYTTLESVIINNTSKEEVERLIAIEKNSRNHEYLNKCFLVAILYDNLTAVELLIINGAKINKVFGEEANTGLHYAVTGGKLAITLLLLKHRADISIKNKEKETPLYLAIKTNQHKNIIKALVDSVVIQVLSTIKDKENNDNSAISKEVKSKIIKEHSISNIKDEDDTGKNVAENENDAGKNVVENENDAKKNVVEAYLNEMDENIIFDLITKNRNNPIYLRKILNREQKKNASGECCIIL